MSSSDNLPSAPLAPRYSPPAQVMPVDYSAVAHAANGNGNGAEKGPQWQRYFAALKRYKWLTLAFIAVGTAAGALATKFIKPEYEVFATIWIQSEGGAQSRQGPIRSGELLQQAAWVELLRSFATSDTVVQEMGLYLQPRSDNDSLVFEGFQLNNKARYRPGSYKLQIEGGKAALITDTGVEVERVPVGDSLGRSLGFMWRPTPKALGTDSRTIEFTVITPREASLTMREQLTATLADNSAFLWLSLRGQKPQLIAGTLNSWTHHFTRIAAELKKKNIVEFARILEGQVANAEVQLKQSEVDLEKFRITTITMPSEGTGGMAGGTQMTTDPVYKMYFEQKLESEQLRRDRESLEKLLEQADRGVITPDALVTVSSFKGAEPLKASLQDLYKAQATLRTQRQFYTSDYKPMKDLEAQARTLEKETIPMLAGQLLDQMKRREAELTSYIASASEELQAIPARTIEEMRLRRQVAVNENLYTTLKARSAEARLSESGALPDVSVLDSAVAPLRPASNTTTRIILMAFAASVALGIALALVLDQVDRRFRYPEQAKDELGLEIIGFVPRIRRRRDGSTDPFEAAQVVEAFRAIRLHLTHSLDGPARAVLTVTSPGEGDGKSLVASNLAMSFAEAGYRTLLIDGDVRRGALHSTFGLPVKPGLLDFLAGKSELDLVVRPTTYENLSLITSGEKHRRGPELLTSVRLTELLAEARGRFDAIVMDSAPLGAGIDAYALGVATGSALIVLRSGHTDRKFADAKLQLAERLPFKLLGAVLNDVNSEGTYQYYSYLEGYTSQYEQEAKSLAATTAEPDNSERGEIPAGTAS